MTSSGAEDGCEQDEIDVLGDQFADHRDEPEEVAEHRQAEAPEHRADEVVQRVASARHLADARGDRREGADDRHEAGDDDGQAAVAREEGVRPLDVLDAEQAGFLAFEDGRAALVADEVADFAADEGRECDRQSDHPDAHTEHPVRELLGRVREQPRDDEERVTREQEADQKPGLGEDDEADDEEGPGSGPADDGGRIEPGDECE